MTAADFDYVRHYVRQQAAIVIDPGKEYLVESRLQQLASRENFDSLDALLSQLQTSPSSQLHRKVIDAMTTNETSFFRDIHPFRALASHILPEIIQKNADQRTLNIWCGAASTGQEPFSVMMTIGENFPHLLDWHIHYLATDICTDALARCNAGRFNQIEVNRGLPAALLIKYFVRNGPEWEFRPDLRKRIQFREMNLVRDWLFMPQLDIVFLRNVLIYFDNDTKKRIFSRIHRLLRPGGYLLLGGAETTFNLSDQFERVPLEQTVCYRTIPPFDPFIP